MRVSWHESKITHVWLKKYSTPLFKKSSLVRTCTYTNCMNVLPWKTMAAIHFAPIKIECVVCVRAFLYECVRDAFFFSALMMTDIYVALINCVYANYTHTHIHTQSMYVHCYDRETRRGRCFFCRLELVCLQFFMFLKGFLLIQVEHILVYW